MFNFNGGWSYSSKQIENLFKYLEGGPSIYVLELGSGDSTVKLYEYLKTKFDTVHFYSLETDNKYLCKDSRIHGILYDSIETCEIPNQIYDLILVDGPTGEVRSMWYSKIKPFCKKGSIIHIDDFCHFETFSKNLDANFVYEVLDFHERQVVSEHCWKTVKLL